MTRTALLGQSVKEALPRLAAKLKLDEDALLDEIENAYTAAAEYRGRDPQDISRERRYASSGVFVVIEARGKVDYVVYVDRRPGRAA